MINARRCLIGSAREFFDRELPGVFTWAAVKHHEAEPMPPLPNGRRDPTGKHREKAVMSFGIFRLEVSSPEDEPPLGRVNLFIGGELVAGGPLDVQVWTRIGNTVKENVRGG